MSVFINPVLFLRGQDLDDMIQRVADKDILKSFGEKIDKIDQLFEDAESHYKNPNLSQKISGNIKRVNPIFSRKKTAKLYPKKVNIEGKIAGKDTQKEIFLKGEKVTKESYNETLKDMQSKAMIHIVGIKIAANMQKKSAYKQESIKKDDKESKLEAERELVKLQQKAVQERKAIMAYIEAQAKKQEATRAKAAKKTSAV